ncbi:SgcJ/EcaC family oxidoreductase [Colwellia psychrerythraea]|uniref:Calcium/calmodulin dependent protein kinase II association-domain protein n=1 Tax=Colwellia psychrerythraea TaxID=28229 RepID=A0A099KJ48_COLPS|nr:SgcJ/EcaC family oxidoreductase [Colwellia psychrerythraea]KGJ89588.1 Calcium/calmodulin dependent protein kinase II association-domain protein [Colwellia psychrerythraea]
MTKQEVTALLIQWFEKLKTNVPKEVTALYATDAVLLPTISNMVRHNHNEIEDYFVQFLANKPSGKLLEQNIRVFNDIAMNSGIYEIKFNDGSCVAARFSFVYQLQDDNWKIIEHHSSRMPE